MVSMAECVAYFTSFVEMSFGLLNCSCVFWGSFTDPGSKIKSEFDTKLLIRY